MSDIAPPQFRAPKRRKTTTIAHKQDGLESKSKPQSGSDDEGDQRKSYVNTRTQIRRKVGVSGMRFSNSNSKQVNDGARDGESMALVSASNGESNTTISTQGLNDRFIVSGSESGAGREVIENDPNMTAYIDAEMARRRQLENHMTTSSSTQRRSQLERKPSLEPESTANQDGSTKALVNTDNQNPLSDSPPPAHVQPQSQPHPSHNQHLTEIDLSAHPLPQPKQAAPAPRKKKAKARLGRDGKPFRPRSRPGPNPDDIARAELVEQVLSERVSAEPGTRAGIVTAMGRARGTGADEDADKRMEREFTREFLERQVGSNSGGGRSAEAKSGKEGSAAGATGVAAVLASGPRLGGSRSARARMVAALEKEREKEMEKEGKDGK